MQKVKTWRSEKYLSYVRQRPCCISGSTYGVIAHHVRCLGGGGMGLKPPDYLCVPLTQALHSELHAIGEKTFWRKYGSDALEIVEMTQARYRAEMAQDAAELISIIDAR